MNALHAERRLGQMAVKVPAVTALFWIIKVLTTGMGETTSDYLAHTINPLVAVVIGGIALLIALALQFSVRRYIPWVYWLAVLMVSVFGTMAADILHVGFGIPYIISALFFAILLGSIFIAWHRNEKTLSIHSIYTFRREIFYWATVLVTFALGTATGDLTASTLHFGYFASGLIFAVIIAIPAVGYYKFGMNEILTFWFAYIITRPLGASFADWMGVSLRRGGLGLGTGSVSLSIFVLILFFVTYLSMTEKKSS